MFIGDDFKRAENDESWYLEPYQRAAAGADPGGLNAAKSFIEHIRAGVKAAAKDTSSMLLFSGGQTRVHGSPLGEGQSYWKVAEAMKWFGHDSSSSGSNEDESGVRWRSLTEDFARDSYENLLFSICRFREVTRRYPERISVVGYELKRRRYEELHVKAIRWSGIFTYVGTELPAGGDDGRRQAEEGEENTFQAYRRDPYGCRAPLITKRMSRDPFRRGLPYSHGCPSLQELFAFCSPEVVIQDRNKPSESLGSIDPSILYNGSLPWPHD